MLPFDAIAIAGRDDNYWEKFFLFGGRLKYKMAPDFIFYSDFE